MTALLMTSPELQMIKKAIYYRAHHRGTKEADWVIGGFIRAHMDDFNAEQILILRDLIDMDDESFFNQIKAPKPKFTSIAQTFQAYKARL